MLLIERCLEAKGWNVRELANAITYSYWPVQCWRSPSKPKLTPTIEVLEKDERLADAK
ncbi:MAG TPA: hypothetical protein VMT61_02570 [Candidatus Binataceae bacterium]|nr:hypothetical protein [Candidatus Binataceae bacterium]